MSTKVQEGRAGIINAGLALQVKLDQAEKVTAAGGASALKKFIEVEFPPSPSTNVMSQFHAGLGRLRDALNPFVLPLDWRVQQAARDHRALFDNLPRSGEIRLDAERALYGRCMASFGAVRKAATALKGTQAAALLPPAHLEAITSYLRPIAQEHLDYLLPYLRGQQRGGTLADLCWGSRDGDTTSQQNLTFGEKVAVDKLANAQAAFANVPFCAGGFDEALRQLTEAFAALEDSRSPTGLFSIHAYHSYAMQDVARYRVALDSLKWTAANFGTALEDRSAAAP